MTLIEIIVKYIGIIPYLKYIVNFQYYGYESMWNNTLWEYVTNWYYAADLAVAEKKLCMKNIVKYKNFVRKAVYECNELANKNDNNKNNWANWENVIKYKKLAYKIKKANANIDKEFVNKEAIDRRIQEIEKNNSRLLTVTTVITVVTVVSWVLYEYLVSKSK